MLICSLVIILVAYIFQANHATHGIVLSLSSVWHGVMLQYWDMQTRMKVIAVPWGNSLKVALVTATTTYMGCSGLLSSSSMRGENDLVRSVRKQLLTIAAWQDKAIVTAMCAVNISDIDIWIQSTDLGISGKKKYISVHPLPVGAAIHTHKAQFLM